MKLDKLLLFILLTLPGLAHAQSLQLFFKNLMTFANKIVLPFLFGIAFLFFVINAVRFFVIEGSNEDGRTKAKNLAIYGVTAFVIIVVFWGIINLLASSIGLDTKKAPIPDYVKVNTK